MRESTGGGPAFSGDVFAAAGFFGFAAEEEGGEGEGKGEEKDEFRHGLILNEIANWASLSQIAFVVTGL